MTSLGYGLKGQPRHPHTEYCHVEDIAGQGKHAAVLKHQRLNQ